MGEYFLWGVYNDRPVYQHISGLDFLYFHKNNVWGAGPKIGGNSAGLLNFGRQTCPYKLVTPWEFGTKLKNQKRQMDPQLSLVCLTNEKPQKPLIIETTVATTTTKKPQIVPQVPQLPKMPQVPQIPQIDGSLLKCGLSNDNVAPFPWQTQIKVLQSRISKHLCSGVILTEKHVLTSASCLTENPMKHYIIVVGQNDLEELDEWEEEFSVQSIFTHDLYDENSGNHDIALVKLKRRRGKYVSFESPHVQPICLPSKIQDHFGENCELSGWGSWQSSGFESDGMTLMGQNVNIDPSCSEKGQICVENPSATSQTDFNFDDGMPLSCKNSRTQRTYLRGLHAKKLDPCRNGCPNMKFLQISEYLDWINARLAL